MGGQAAEQIIAGVVLSERLAVTMYGAIHRAQFSGQRNLRALWVDPRMLADDAFRAALTEPHGVATATSLDHACIVPTFGVESNGADVVVVTRGVGRYVTVQDLISSARANRAQGGKLSLPVAAAIGKSVVEALAASHDAGVVHGAVHPRSVLVDEDGGVRLGDFVVGRALTTAVAQGADSALWRGLAGYLAPELVVGEDPTPACDVFAVGALMFTMLSGEAPPGTLHVTPAVERLVQRALDTDSNRRYRSARDLLENLLEAFEDDRWEIAARGEVIKAAGLSETDTNIDDATEDLLASLGPSLGTVQASPIRPSMDIRAEAVAIRHQHTPTGTTNKLDALLADLDDAREHTVVEDMDRFKRDPISELISHDPRKREAIVQAKPRVPSLDDLDDLDEDAAPAPSYGRRESPRSLSHRRPNSTDESAAMDALLDLDGPVQRVSSAAEQAVAAADKLELAATRAEAAARRVETNNDAAARRDATPLPVRPVVLDAMPDFDVRPPRLKSRAVGLVSLLLVGGGAVGFYLIYKNQQEQKAKQALVRDEAQRTADELSRKLSGELPDPGAIRVRSTPSQAGVWLKLGRTPLASLALSSSMMHELRVDGIDGFQAVDTQVIASHWEGESTARKAKVVVALQPTAKDAKTGKPLATRLPAMPAKPPAATGFTPGRGPLHIETTPPGAEVWLFVGMTDQVELAGIQAGLGYELRVIKDGFRPAYVAVAPDDWRDGGDPNLPINAARKKPVLEKAVTLEPDPDAATGSAIGSAAGSGTGRAAKKSKQGR
ncbi:MAG: protein kinase [Myxococcota bacterium]|nr:protein kinase [Myxococcota bacterium]